MPKEHKILSQPEESRMRDLFRAIRVGNQEKIEKAVRKEIEKLHKNKESKKNKNKEHEYFEKME